MSKDLTGNIVDWHLFKRVIALAKPFKSLFIVAVLLAITLSVLGPLRPFLIQQTIDNHILLNDGPGLVNMIILLLILLVASAVFRYLFTYGSNLLGQSIIKDLRTRVFKHILRFRLRYFDLTPVGQSTTRTISDVETISDIFAQGIITIFADLLTIAVVLALMFYTDWKLTLLTLLTFPLFIYATYVFKEKVKAAFQVIRTQISVMNSFLQERITGMSIVQIFGAEETEYKKFVAINTTQKEEHIKTIMYYSVFFPVLEIIQALALGLLIWFGSNQVLSGQATLGILIAFIMYIRMLFRPLRMLADKFNTLQMGLVASDRIFSLLDREEVIPNTGHLNKTSLEGKISFQDVSFAYNEIDLVLKNISLEIAQGETIAFVGATGAGKSSIINILNRFYGIQKGKILIDDVEIEKYDLQFLRSNIGLILQDVFLFAGSIYENITLRNPDIKKEQVYEAAKFIGAHEFIQKLPEQYDYNVMERGATLSLGQRQLISIIRTFVYNPRILIMDEATSSIDTETELLVQEATEKLIQNRTAIVIAHRLSTIKNADRIIVLDKGRIVEQGSHEKLIQVEGYYKKLYDMQFAQEQKAKLAYS